MYYFWVQNTEDGLRIRGLSTAELIARIKATTSEDIVPENRVRFIDYLPDVYTDIHFVCVIKGDIAMPKPVKRVTEWEIP
jgi:hypothetical protein